MTCEKCANCQSNSPIYTLKQLCCCIRLVRNSRPMRAKQDAMLEIIERTPEAATREAILAGLTN